jgi:hypothetical protein
VGGSREEEKEEGRAGGSEKAEKKDNQARKIGNSRGTAQTKAGEHDSEF